MLRSMGLGTLYGAVVGVVLIVIGLLGFVGNPIVGDPSAHPLFVTGTVHNLIHIVSGTLGLYIAFGLSGRQQGIALIGFGVLCLAFVVLTLINSSLFGILNYPI